VDAVDIHLRRYPSSPIVQDVLGTSDPDRIRRIVRELVPDLAEIFEFRTSVGAVFGVRRRDGSRIALKIHTLYTDATYLEDVQRLQAALAGLGFPTPRPLGRSGTATMEDWVDFGQFRDAHDPRVRRVLAETLVLFHQLATSTGIRPRRPSLRPAGALWPRPHNVLFDFDASVFGAEWIDEIATAARAVTDVSSGVEAVGHTDWSVKHFRFDTCLRPTIVYDWDSVTVDREPLLVGTAAGSFTYTEELPGNIAVWPTTDESLAFLDEYESSRSEPFGAADRRAAKAACVYLRAYAARCHHAVGGDARETGLEGLAEALLR
jgi:hypothetical protein